MKLREIIGDYDYVDRFCVRSCGYGCVRFKFIVPSSEKGSVDYLVSVFGDYDVTAIGFDVDGITMPDYYTKYDYPSGVLTLSFYMQIYS